MKKDIVYNDKIEKIHQILDNIFLDEDLGKIKSISNFDELVDWDSINQMALAYQIEKLLKTKLRPDEVESLISYSSIIDLILKKK